MMRNLEGLLFNKGISKKSYAELLGVTEKTLRNKMSGHTEFCHSEIRKTCELLFPEYKFDYIFAEVESADDKTA